jgi:soluble lytic murein transglycosylase-like protein
MGGIRAFERRYAWWIRMRERMSWKAYDSARDRSMRKAAIAFLVGFSVCTFIYIAAVLAGASSAHGQVPTDANRYRLTLIREARAAWGLNAPVAAFAGQIHQESGWNANATSPMGAVGMAQFMPSTSAWLSGLYPSLAEHAPRHPTWAIRAMVTYDLRQYRAVRKANDDCQRFAFALSAYNGGLAWVHRRQAISTQPGTCFGLTCTLNPGIRPAAQAENEAYPRRVLLVHQKLYANWGQGICS